MRIISLLKRLLAVLFKPQQQQPYSEQAQLLAQIKVTQVILDNAWDNLQFAEQAYIDIAIRDIQQAETQYSLLNRKYRMLAGCPSSQLLLATDYNPRTLYPWLKQPSQCKMSQG